MCVCVCLRILSIMVSADSPPSTVTPLSLISNIKSKRTSALKTNTNRTCYVTPLLCMKKTPHIFQPSHFSSWKFQEKMAISICIEIPLLLHCPSWRETKKTSQKSTPKKNTLNPTRWPAAQRCPVRYGSPRTAAAGSSPSPRTMGGQGFSSPQAEPNEGRTVMNAMVNLPPPPHGVCTPVRNKGFVTEKPWKYKED